MLEELWMFVWTLSFSPSLCVYSFNAYVNVFDWLVQRRFIKERQGLNFNMDESAMRLLLIFCCAGQSNQRPKATMIYHLPDTWGTKTGGARLAEGVYTHLILYQLHLAISYSSKFNLSPLCSQAKYYTGSLEMLPQAKPRWIYRLSCI